MSRTVLLLITTLSLTPLAPAGEWRIRDQHLTSETFNKAELLQGEPIPFTIETATVEGPAMIPNATRDGYIGLLVYFEYAQLQYDIEAAAVDFNTGKVTKFLIPRAINPHIALANIVFDKAGRGYVFMCEPWKGGQLWCYDPAANTVQAVAASPPELGLGHNTMAVPSDGRIYWSTTRSGRIGLASYDPRDGKVRSHGFLGPKFTRGGETRAYKVNAWGDYVYLAMGKIPWYLVAYNVKTQESKVLLEAPSHGRGVWTWDKYAYRRVRKGEKDRVEYFELQGDKVLPLKRNPGRIRQDPSIPKPEIWTEALAPGGDGVSLLCYKLPGTEDWKRVEIEVKTYPQVIKALTALPGHRLLGTAGAYKGNFIYDPITDRGRWMGIIHLSHYCTVVHEGKIYMSGYAGGATYEYDPLRPWTAFKAELGHRPPRINSPQSNPRQVAYLENVSRAHKMWSAVVGADGKLYFAGEVVRQGDGGALGWYDADTGETGGVDWKRLMGFKTYHACAVNDAKTIVLNTRLTRNNLTGERADTAKMFVFDVERKEIVDELEPVKGAVQLGHAFEVMPGKVLSFADMGEKAPGDVLFGVDVKARRVVFRKTVPARFAAYHHGSGGAGLNRAVLAPDGSVWTLAMTEASSRFPALVRIDPVSAEIRVLGRVLGIGAMAFIDDDLYRAIPIRGMAMERFRDIASEDTTRP